jgi:hypothetical protein
MNVRGWRDCFALLGLGIIGLRACKEFNDVDEIVSVYGFHQERVGPQLVSLVDVAD